LGLLYAAAVSRNICAPRETAKRNCERQIDLELRLDSGGELARMGKLWPGVLQEGGMKAYSGETGQIVKGEREPLQKNPFREDQEEKASPE